MNDTLAAPRHEKARKRRRGWLTRERALVLVLMATTVLALAICCVLVWPFLSVLAWALALGIIARPMHRAIAVRVRQADVAAGLAVAVVAVVLIVPLGLVLYNLVQETTVGAER